MHILWFTWIFCIWSLQWNVHGVNKMFSMKLYDKLTHYMSTVIKAAIHAAIHWATLLRQHVGEMLQTTSNLFKRLDTWQQNNILCCCDQIAGRMEELRKPSVFSILGTFNWSSWIPSNNVAQNPVLPCIQICWVGEQHSSATFPRKWSEGAPTSSPSVHSIM